MEKSTINEAVEWNDQRNEEILIMYQQLMKPEFGDNWGKFSNTEKGEVLWSKACFFVNNKN